MHLSRVEDEFMHRRGVYHASRQSHLILTKQVRGHTSQYLQMGDEPTHKASHRRRVEVKFNKADRARNRRVRCLLRRGLPTGSSTPMIIPSSNADPSPVRPALQPLYTMTQLREMSATRV